jgi:hypothetical protein
LVFTRPLTRNWDMRHGERVSRPGLRIARVAVQVAEQPVGWLLLLP